MSKKRKILITAAAIILLAALAVGITAVATNNFGMPSQVLYPVLKGGCLITVNVTASVFFGEKITARSILGSCVALVGMVIMNLW